jgi:phosphoribosylformylglycinamidine synthase
VRNVVAVGARPLGLTDCLNFGDPTVPEHLGAMVAAIDGLSYAARRLATPFVSGNVSLYNQSKSGRTVAPSPIVACVGGIDDIAKTATMAFKAIGSAVFAIGACDARLGGSVYAELLGINSASLPAVDYGDIERTNALVLAAYRSDMILAAHDISDGGTLVALAKMAFATHEGARIGAALISGERDGSAGDAAFAEAAGFLVEVPDDGTFAALASAMRVPCLRLATTTGDYALRFADGMRTSLDGLHDVWSAPLRDFYASAGAR